MFDFAKNYINTTNFHPLRHVHGLLAIVKTIEDISLNDEHFRSLDCESYLKENKTGERLFDW